MQNCKKSSKFSKNSKIPCNEYHERGWVPTWWACGSAWILTYICALCISIQMSGTYRSTGPIHTHYHLFGTLPSTWICRSAASLTCICGSCISIQSDGSFHCPGPVPSVWNSPMKVGPVVVHEKRHESVALAYTSTQMDSPTALAHCVHPPLLVWLLHGSSSTGLHFTTFWPPNFVQYFLRTLHFLLHQSIFLARLPLPMLQLSLNWRIIFGSLITVCVPKGDPLQNFSKIELPFLDRL